MVIILEGPDGGGKTTLATKLSLMTGYKVKHYSYPKDQDEADAMFLGYCDDFVGASNIIVDRCWYSDLAYGPVMRGRATITYPQMYELEKMIAKRGGIIIYCTDTKAALWQRISKRGDDFIHDREKFNTICDNYETLFGVPHILPVVKYNFNILY